MNKHIKKGRKVARQKKLALTGGKDQQQTAKISKIMKNSRDQVFAIAEKMSECWPCLSDQEALKYTDRKVRQQYEARILKRKG